jgi:methyl-accepting chemotaxis protein
MKVATKFALAFIASAILSIVVYSAVAASREVEQLEDTVAEDLASVGRTLRTSVITVWEKEGEERALELIERQDDASESETIDVKLTWLDVESSNTKWPRGGLAVIPSLKRGDQLTWVEQRPDGTRGMYVYVPLIRPGARPSALEISRPLVRESDLFWRAVRAQVLSATIVAAIASLLAISLTSWMLSAPLARLSVQARRIGAGDFTHRVQVRGTDEVATLTNELNAMADQLLESRNREKDATEKRLSALEQLRHADRLRTVGTLASGIAHELGTPLNVIAMRAKMIATGEVPPE